MDLVSVCTVMMALDPTDRRELARLAAQVEQARTALVISAILAPHRIVTERTVKSVRSHLEAMLTML